MNKTVKKDFQEMQKWNRLFEKYGGARLIGDDNSEQILSILKDEVAKIGGEIIIGLDIRCHNKNIARSIRFLDNALEFITEDGTVIRTGNPHILIFDNYHWNVTPKIFLSCLPADNPEFKSEDQFVGYVRFGETMVPFEQYNENPEFYDKRFPDIKSELVFGRDATFQAMIVHKFDFYPGPPGSSNV